MFGDITLTRKGKIVFGSLFIMLLIPVAVYGFSVSQKSNLTLSQLTGTQVLDASTIETQEDILGKIAKHVILPEGEEGDLARVSNVASLKNKELFKNVQDGDYLLIYQQARKVIVYRPGEDRIVDVLSLASDVSSVQTSPSIILSPTPKEAMPVVSPVGGYEATPATQSGDVNSVDQ